MKHSRRWRLYIRCSKMFELLFRAGVSILNQSFLQNIHVWYMKIESVLSFPTSVLTFGSRETFFADHTKVHSHFEDDPWFEDEGHNLSLKWGGAPYYNILCKGRDLAPGGVNGNSVGNTFFSLTKVKVNIDIKFNIYLKFDLHLK